MHRYHINSDYSETGAFGRDAGTTGRVFPEPSGNATGYAPSPKEVNIRRDLEALKVTILLKVRY